MIPQLKVRLVPLKQTFPSILRRDNSQHCFGSFVRPSSRLHVNHCYDTFYYLSAEMDLITSDVQTSGRSLESVATSNSKSDGRELLSGEHARNRSITHNGSCTQCKGPRPLTETDRSGLSRRDEESTVRWRAEKEPRLMRCARPKVAVLDLKLLFRLRSCSACSISSLQMT